MGKRQQRLMAWVGRAPGWSRGKARLDLYICYTVRLKGGKEPFGSLLHLLPCIQYLFERGGWPEQPGALCAGGRAGAAARLRRGRGRAGALKAPFKVCKFISLTSETCPSRLARS